MVQFEPLLRLPSSEELPCSDDTPVDNELQNLIPNLLLNILDFIWPERQDWFFGVDMGIYYLYENQRQTTLIPDGFLSIGVKKRPTQKGRLSYVLWEENDIPPIFALEIVSKNYNQEYEDKKDKYRKLGVLYYLIYNPHHWQRDQHQPFELYRLEKGKYILQTGEPYWMPELGLGIGRGRLTHIGWEREWLLWYSQEGVAYRVAKEIIENMQKQLEQERQRVQQAEIRVQQAEIRVQQAEIRAQQAEIRAQQEKQLREQQKRQIVTQLFSLGLDLEQIATACNLSVEEVRKMSN
ncbi:MAG: Uma2 family endonuclease [Okeania sp. SIO2D1]|nr:Uma2 family endonuclease [Okeania sp. SIO2D1]